MLPTLILIQIKTSLKNKDKVCRAVEHERMSKVSAKFENGANVQWSDCLYSKRWREVRRMVHIKCGSRESTCWFLPKERLIMFLILWMKIIFWFLTQKCPTC